MTPLNQAKIVSNLRRIYGKRCIEKSIESDRAGRDFMLFAFGCPIGLGDELFQSLWSGKSGNVRLLDSDPAHAPADPADPDLWWLRRVLFTFSYSHFITHFFSHV